MPRRAVTFALGEYYHVYNRGVDGRDLITDQYDAERFLLGLALFNSVEPIRSIYLQSFTKNTQLSGPTTKSQDRLVDVIDYCFNPNHFHLILREQTEGGISEFMKRFGGGYSSYFNNRQGRLGTLYQSAFQAKHIDTNEYLLWVHAYVSQNDKVHQLSGPTAKLVRSSLSEYVEPRSHGICNTKPVLEQFKDVQAYKRFLGSTLELIRRRKDHLQVLARLGVE